MNKLLHYARPPTFRKHKNSKSIIVRSGFSGTLNCLGACEKCHVRFKCFTIRGHSLDLNEREWLSVFGRESGIKMR